MTLLSVIIPVYNVADTLDECVGSIVSQSYADIEVILVDDGSPDECPKLCDKWAERDSRIKVIHQENKGLSGARNTGIDAATGEFITFVDSDDFVLPDTYEKIMSHFADDVDIVEYSYTTFVDASVNDSESNGFQNSPFCSSKQAILDSKTGYFELQNRPFCNAKQAVLKDKTYSSVSQYVTETKAYRHFYAWNKVYRRSIFDGIRYPEGKVFEDVFTTPYLIYKARCIATTSEGMYYYRQNPNGITGKATAKQIAMHLEAYRNIMEQWPDWVDTEFYLRAVNVQLDVCRMTGCEPTLPHRHCETSLSMTLTDLLKSIMLNTFGLKTLCKINRIYSRRKANRC